MNISGSRRRRPYAGAVLLLMALAMWAYTLAIVCYRVRTLIIEREGHTDWVQALPEVAGVKA